jgi:hypothetical protein
MTITQNAVIAMLAVTVAVCGFYYYQNRQNVVEIKLPSVKIEKQ